MRLTKAHELDSKMVHTPVLTEWQEPLWYVLFVRSNQERMIAYRLEYFEVEHCLPTYPMIRQWKDRVVKLDRPLFPGYVFVRIPFVDRSKVLTLPNVVSLVGTKSAPSVISEDEITRIKAGVAEAHAEPHPYLKSGERVVISEGPLAGTEGILVRRGRGPRVVIAVDSIRRAFSVEVDAAAIESC